MIVLDAAAVVDVLVDRPHAGWVLERVDGADVCAPGHQPAEVLSALSRLRRAGYLDDRGLAGALAEYAALPQDLVEITAAHLRRATDLSERIRVLDGLYVAVAEERSCAIVTTDRRLGRSQAPCEVVVAPGTT